MRSLKGLDAAGASPPSPSPCLERVGSAVSYHYGMQVKDIKRSVRSQNVMPRQVQPLTGGEAKTGGVDHLREAGLG